MLCISFHVPWGRQISVLALLSTNMLPPTNRPTSLKQFSWAISHAMSLPNLLPCDENRAVPGLSIYMWLGCGIATVIIGSRLVTRIALKQAAGWDDFFIGVSYVRLQQDYHNLAIHWPESQLFAIVLYIGTAILLAHGYGRHIYYIAPSDLILLLKLNTIVNIAGFTSLAFARTSIGFVLLRLTAQVSTWEWVVYFSLALNTIQAVALIVSLVCIAYQSKKIWDPTSSGFCIPPKQFTAADRFLGW